jgi:diguanylate cyclase (GGDEF)-like protein
MAANTPLHRSLRCVLAALGAVFAGEASALCLSYADPEFARYETLMGTDPAWVAEIVSTRLASSATKDPALRASLYSLQTEAQGSLERYAEAREAARNGLALVADARDPIRVNLLQQGAMNTFDEERVPGMIASVEAARAAQERGSPAEACLLVALGALEHFSGQAHRASLHLTQAYRMSVGAERRQQRVLAADVLSLVMSDEGDFAQALALLQEVIDYQTENGATFDLAVSRFMRGAVLRDAKDHRGALVEFEASRRLGSQMKDTLGVAYANLYMCLSNVDLGALREARGQCIDALQPFDIAQAGDPRKQTLAALAEIDLRENAPAAALERLDAVLDAASGDLAQHRIAAMHELRARAHDALGHHEQALTDYKAYMERSKAAMDAERMRETTALRARFETDREIERNDFLQRELAAQSRQLRWTIVAAAAGVMVIALLSVLLILNRRQKVLLARLARADDLTGLPNRRHMLEIATTAFELARRSSTPLTVAVIDLDHFKRINDQFGHATGDRVLQEFAHVCRATIRESDACGRWGGEEFLIVLPHTTLDTALGVVERVRAAAQGIRGGTLPESLRVSLSAGLATNEGAAARLEDVITNADAALYDAKKSGRDLVCVAQESYSLASTGVRRALKHSGIALSTGRFERREAAPPSRPPARLLP